MIIYLSLCTPFQVVFIVFFLDGLVVFFSIFASQGYRGWRSDILYARVSLNTCSA